MLEARLVHLERRGHAEDGPALLHGHDPSGCEARAVADRVNVVDDRSLDVPRPQEVGVQAVGAALDRDGLVGGRERLP